MTQKLSGMTKVLQNLNKEIDKIKGKTMSGLIRASAVIRYDVEKTPPVTPVDTGNLRASIYTVTMPPSTGEETSADFVGPDAGEMQNNHSQEIQRARAELQKYASKGPVVALGYSANYALKVHESYNMKFKRPGSGPGFLQAAIKRNEDEILRVIAEEAKI